MRCKAKNCFSALQEELILVRAIESVTTKVNKMSKNGSSYEIKEVEYCPSASGQPHIVTVERILKQGREEIKKEFACFLYMNHVYKNGRFIPKTKFNGWNYNKKSNFQTPIKTFNASNGIGEFVAAEFNKRFQDQREREGW